MTTLDTFIRLTDNLVEFEAEFNMISSALHSTYSLEVHREEVRSIWSIVKSGYEACLRDIAAKDEDKDFDVDLESVKQRYRNSYQTYVRCVAKIGEFTQLLPQTSTSSSLNQVPSTSSNFHLPPCDTQIFSGDYLSWPSFRDMFTAIYINNTRLSAVEKLFHLSQKTRGEALDIVKKSPLTNDGFFMAWKNLKDRFENKRILINSQLRILFNLPSISTESSTAIKKLQRDINSCVSALQLHDINIQNWDPIFVYLCSSRLPDATLSLWEQSIDNKTEIPLWPDLDSFLTSRYRTLETVSDIKGSANQKASFHKPQSSYEARSQQKRVNSYVTNFSSPFCKLCPKEQHTIRQCSKFLNMNQDERMSCIKKLGLCLNCFAGSHNIRDCKSLHNCFKCNKRHNTLLHIDVSYNVSAENTVLPSTSKEAARRSGKNYNSAGPRSHATQIQSTETIPVENIQSCFASNFKSVLLGTAIVHVCHLGITYSARALIDSGSEGTFISERLFRLLKLPFRKTLAQISGLNNAVSAQVQKICAFTLSSPMDSKISIEAAALVVPSLTGHLPSHPLDPSFLAKIPNIQLADNEFFKSSAIDILIGGDLFPLVMQDGIQRNIGDTSVLAQETIFGWILTGPVSNDSVTSLQTCVSFFTEISLDKEISRFWEVEDLPHKHHMSPSDRFCEENFVNTTKRNEDGRYVVKLPFKDSFPDSINLGHSRAIAHAQFMRNEFRLTKNPYFKIQYDSVVLEYLDLNHMQLVSSPKFQHVPRHYYLPHHAVIKPESTTTRVRVVFNASSASSNGISLNDVLHIGPTLQSDLTILILKWRFFQFVFNGDIQKMYRQILVHPDHRPFQRILFRNSSNDQVCDYELQTVTFGVNCAPYLAIRTLLQLADDTERSYPLASHILRKSMYVDDALAGAHDIATARKARDELIAALSSAGFSLRKWTSNSKDVLEGLPTDHLLHDDFLEFEDTSTAKTLGVQWNASSDQFFFTTKPLEHKSAFTKREVLSQISKLFDPAGWLSPCIIIAKMLMQQIWLQQIGWDENIPSNCLKIWHSFLTNYPHINNIRIPRWVKYTTSCKIQFHAFCDASEKAYAATIYVRIDSSGIISTHLLAGKTKVAPVKSISLPRLELCGATLLADMVEALLPQLDIPKYETFFWTDSTIVLAWLSKPPCLWTTFVANRVSKIVQSVGHKNWFHVSSLSNPADLASRGVLPQDLCENDLWWNGPTWLKLAPSSWPNSIQGVDIETNLEKKSSKSFFSYFKDYEDILERFSSYPKAIHVIAYVFRFFYHTHPNYRSSFSENSNLIKSSEVHQVKMRLIILSQKVMYAEEYNNLSKKEPIRSGSSLLNLNPFLDEAGLLRVCGRLVSSPVMTYDERHPIILPYNCQFSRLMVGFTHQISLHGENQLVLRLLRLQFWIPKARNLIKTIIHNCKICTIYKQKVQTQLMGSLPPERTVLTRPFAHTGLDFAGPFEIKNYTGRACLITKGYVCVFVCFATKAIHLEATSSLSTSVFLAAFYRFVSRRGCPLHLYSDNGTTFVGASKVLSREFISLARDAVTSNFSHQGVTWHFIPPGAPHMGGLWEAGVKSFKTHFRKIAGNFKYTFEEMSTLIARIEACLNSRPISPMSEDPSDNSALTPGHFLIGGPLYAPIESKITEHSVSIINRWQRLKALQQEFCSRWKNEYLKELHKRNKWKNPQINIEENAMVVIKHENLPPTEWRLGRIVKIYSGSDSRVRVADIMTQRGLIKRPIVKLVVLPNQ